MKVKPSRLFRWQFLTVALMLVGYSGYYLCRSNLSVALPLIADELAARGLAPDHAGEKIAPPPKQVGQCAPRELMRRFDEPHRMHWNSRGGPIFLR